MPREGETELPGSSPITKGGLKYRPRMTHKGGTCQAEDRLEKNRRKERKGRGDVKNWLSNPSISAARNHRNEGELLDLQAPGHDTGLGKERQGGKKGEKVSTGKFHQRGKGGIIVIRSWQGGCDYERRGN